MAENISNEGPQNLEQILEIVYIHLGGDRARIDRWLKSPNAALGGVQPMDMIRQGQPEKLLEAVQSEIEVTEGSGGTR